MPIAIGDELSALDGLNKEDVMEMDLKGLSARFVKISGLREKLTEEMHWVLSVMEAKKNEEHAKGEKRKLEEVEEEEAEEEVEEVD